MMKNKKTQLKTISPTMRGKKRYLCFKIISDLRFTRRDIENGLWACYLDLYGSYVCSIMRPWLVDWDEKNNVGIMRYSLNYDKEARAGILFLSRFSDKEVSVKIKKVSGAVGKLK